VTDKQYKNVLMERDGGATFLMLNRPERRNAMSPELHYEMEDAIDTLATDKETKILVLRRKSRRPR
jgi:trans-feruloyl-CoA hydratase/vanillin synthase